MEDQLARLAARRGVRHAVLGLASGDGALQWSGALAAPGAGEAARLSGNTPFWIASVTKLFIAAAVLRLHEHGALDIDAPAQACIPAEVIGGLHRMNGVDHTPLLTLRHLLAHASGLPDWLEDRPRGGKGILEQLDREEDRLITIAEAMEFVRSRLSPHFAPQDLSARRVRIRYSDTNFQLLMAAIEAASGRSVHAVFEEFFYTPLDLRHTRHPEHRGPKDVEAALPVFDGESRLDKPLLIQSFRDLYSTAEELLRFMRAMVTGQLFERPETARMMQGSWHGFGLPTDAAALRLPGWPIEYGLGMMRLDMPRLFTAFRKVPPIVGHTGVSGTWLFHCAERDLFLCGAVNQMREAALPFRLVPALLRRLPEDMA